MLNSATPQYIHTCTYSFFSHTHAPHTQKEFSVICESILYLGKYNVVTGCNGGSFYHSIATIADSTLQAQQRWERYLQRLSKSAWGDNIQAIGNMLNMIQPQETLLTLIHVTNPSQNNVYIGLVMQYHYVAWPR